MLMASVGQAAGVPACKRALLILLLGLWSGCRGCGPAASEPAFLLGGIQVNEPDHGVWAQALVDNGMNAVSVTVYAKQGDWDRAHLWWSEQEPAVVSEIRAAKARGLKVVLILRVALDHAYSRNTFLWHGMINPSGRGALDAWFLRYSEFVTAWARQAQILGVDVLGLGSELSELSSTRRLAELPDLYRYYLDADAQARMHQSLLNYEAQILPKHWAALGGGDYPELRSFLSARSEVWRVWAEQGLGPGSDTERLQRLNQRRRQLDLHWRALIAQVREIYAGKLTYAANFDQYFEVGFWDALDIIGINAYFQLRDPSRARPAGDSLQEELRDGWKGVFTDIQRMRRTQKLGDKPVLFTELGYTQHHEGTFEPWAMQGLSVLGPAGAQRLYIWQEQPKAPEERAEAVRALAWAQRTMPGVLSGVLYWKLTTKTYHRDIEPFALLLGGAVPDPLLAALQELASSPD